jgi:hypothetical protein
MHWQRDLGLIGGCCEHWNAPASLESSGPVSSSDAERMPISANTWRGDSVALPQHKRCSWYHGFEMKPALPPIPRISATEFEKFDNLFRKVIEVSKAEVSAASSSGKSTGNNESDAALAKRRDLGRAWRILWPSNSENSTIRERAVKIYDDVWNEVFGHLEEAREKGFPDLNSSVRRRRLVGCPS